MLSANGCGSSPDGKTLYPVLRYIATQLQTEGAMTIPHMGVRGSSVPPPPPCGGGPNGLAIGPDGYYYLCNNGGSRYAEGHSMGLAPHPDYHHGSIQLAHLTRAAAFGSKIGRRQGAKLTLSAYQRNAHLV